MFFDFYHPAARGLDIPEVGHIIHYHLPVNEETLFTHRNGRTARWDATGIVLSDSSCRRKLPSYIPEEMEIVVLPQKTLPGLEIGLSYYIYKKERRRNLVGSCCRILI